MLLKYSIVLYSLEQLKKLLGIISFSVRFLKQRTLIYLWLNLKDFSMSLKQFQINKYFQAWI